MEDEGHCRSLHPNTTQRLAPPIELRICRPFHFALPRNNSSTAHRRVKAYPRFSSEFGLKSQAEAVKRMALFKETGVCVTVFMHGVCRKLPERLAQERMPICIPTDLGTYTDGNVCCT